MGPPGAHSRKQAVMGKSMPIPVSSCEDPQIWDSNLSSLHINPVHFPARTQSEHGFSSLDALEIQG